MPAPPKYRYVIRNGDGSIKAASKAPGLSAGAGETLVESTEHYHPAKYRYDFGGQHFVMKTDDELAASKAAASAAAQAIADSRAQLAADIKASAATLSSTEKEMWEKLGQLLGYDFGP